MYRGHPDEEHFEGALVTVEDHFGGLDSGRLDRRSLPRLAPASRIWAAVENTTRNEMLGMAEVVDFSGLGLALRGVSGDPVAALGDSLWVTIIAEEGIIPVRAKLVRIRREGLFGLQLKAPPAPGQHFLLCIYERAAVSLSLGHRPAAG